MKALYLIAISNSVLGIFFLTLPKNRNQANYLLMMWLAAMTLVLGSSYALKSGLTNEYPHLLGLDLAVPLLCGPFLFLYAFLIVGRQRKLAPKDMLHLVPFLAYFLFLAFTLYSRSAAYKLDLLNGEVFFMSRSWYRAINLMIVLHAFTYSGFTYLLLLRSDFGDKTVIRWLKGLTGAIVLINMVFGLAFLDRIFPGRIWRHISIEFLYFILVAVVYSFVTLALRFPHLFDYYKGEKARYSKSNLTRSQIESTWKHLLDKMERDKPYLKTGLSLSELAGEMGVLSKTLSQVINEKSGQNFSRFVSRYRVNEFKRKVQQDENRNYTLEAIAKDCGFSTKSSFHTVFKREERTTPYLFAKALSTGGVEES